MNRTKIEDVLLSMGIPAGIKGFTYIADAIEIFNERGTDIFITKELYPVIAKKNSTIASRVERSIRHAFEVARSCKGDYETINHYIGFINCENSSSLKMLYNRIKQDIGYVEEKDLIHKQEETEEDYSVLRMIMREELSKFFGGLREVKA